MRANNSIFFKDGTIKGNGEAINENFEKCFQHNLGLEKLNFVELSDSKHILGLYK